MNVSKEILNELALSEEEYKLIVQRLGREPNRLELGMFGSLWSEHCGYKHSKPLLSLFKTKNNLLIEPGVENAGVVEIGEGLGIVMKIESHNHPSAIEPFEGAATGVGGIVRDIFAMGARPIALLNSLRFGPLTDSRNRYLFEEVVSGISSYGNCIGIPNVGGEVFFQECYSGNPLVNAMCVGIVNTDNLIRATTGKKGNILILVGADTGRDGIHGASGLASQSFDDEQDLRPTVQVGNPFLEKILIEACMEISTKEFLIGIQDLGAAGLTSAIVESAAKAGAGFEIDISQIPKREQDMDAYDVMLSESQERMLIIAKPGTENLVKEVFDKWDLQSSVIGRVTNDGLAKIYDDRELQCDVPIDILANSPTYILKGEKPTELEGLNSFDFSNISISEISAEKVFLKLLSSSNIISRESIYRQYDHQVQTNTVVCPGSDAALLRIKGSNKSIALTTDCNSRYVYLDPYVGGMIAIAEACRNLSVTGAKPLALTDCLNFGNPENPEIYYQLEQCIKGMAEASNAFDTPVVSGNVSLYNESYGENIYPTPIIGAVGVLEDSKKYVTSAFKNEGDQVVLLGYDKLLPGGLAGSEYMANIHELIVGSPKIDLAHEIKIQSICRKLIDKEIINSAHDCSEGGLAIALAECSIISKIGFVGELEFSGRWDDILFGELQSRIIVTVKSGKFKEFMSTCLDDEIKWVEIGYTGGNSFVVNDLINISLNKLSEVWGKNL
ncbi:MAG: phosphoribosylformylglycinamidine synthase II [Chloroflexi bacterium]|nr:phosphoribosylformylglycinamidine synthase II [Chloroflexota bacterium]|tara:strand:+ start:8547 stop:10730 length:2184 start_codon:yes stop_codon:yes gene_type:complete